MENCFWNGKALTAAEIAQIYELEKEIRKASGRKEICCPDPECQYPILRYCHGEKKDAYFAHINNEHCDYAVFDKGNSQLIRTIRKILYEHFKASGYSVHPEVKVIDHHYAHLLFDMADGSKVAVEIGTQQLSANRIEYLTRKYKEKNIAVKWIVIGNTGVNLRENQTFFLKRYLLNESANKDLLVISWDGAEIAQYKLDPNRYEYAGEIIKSTDDLETYFDCCSLSSLVFEGNELSLIGFAQKFELWLSKKRADFNRKIAEVEKENQRQCELEKLCRDTLQQASTASSPKSDTIIPKSHVTPTQSQLDITYEERKQSILPFIEQQESLVRDSLGVRWIKCEKCGTIDSDNQFSCYGGTGHNNLGLCRNCDGTERPPHK